MPEPRGYSVAFARDMIPDKMAAYSAALPPIYDKYQGGYLAIGGPGRGVDWLAGDWTDRLIMIGAFPNLKAVGDFWWGPEYRAASKLRAGAVRVDVAQVEGTDAVVGDELRCFLLIARVNAEAWLPDEDGAGTALIAADAPDVTTLEGDLDGISLTLLGFEDRGELDRLWARVSAELSDARACAVGRAPEK